MNESVACGPSGWDFAADSREWDVLGLMDPLGDEPPDIARRPDQAISLGNGMHFVRLADAQRIARACVPLGEGIDISGCSQLRYAIIRPHGGGGVWDADGALSEYLAMLSLVRPNLTGFHFAAIVRGGTRARVLPVYGFMNGDPPRSTFMHRQSEGWVGNEHAIEAAAIHAAFTVSSADFPARLLRAFHARSHASRTYFRSERWPLAIRALECLVHAEDPGTGSKQRFVDRLTRLSRKLNVTPIGRDSLLQAYDFRSYVVHGSVIPDAPYGEEGAELQSEVEQFLRVLLLALVQRQDAWPWLASEQALRVAIGETRGKGREINLLRARHSVSTLARVSDGSTIESPRLPSSYQLVSLLIDTGCTTTSIPRVQLEALHLERKGFLWVNGSHGELCDEVFLVDVKLLDESGDEVICIHSLPVTATDDARGTLGIDILRFGRLEWNGPGGTVSLRFREPATDASDLWSEMKEEMQFSVDRPESFAGRNSLDGDDSTANRHPKTTN